MTENEFLMLKDGDEIRCWTCPEFGCDGRPAKVRLVKMPCGCVSVYHERNPIFMGLRISPLCTTHSWDKRVCAPARHQAEVYKGD